MGDYFYKITIPVFFFGIAIEMLISLWRRKDLYTLGDTMGNLGLTLWEQIIGLFLHVPSLLLYIYVYENWQFAQPNLTWQIVLAMVGVDFFYYWWHRFSHEVNALWAFHVVHHQSEEFNLSVAIRQTTFSGLTSRVFYVPLAFLGVRVEWVLLAEVVNGLYQFWIHTKWIGKLGKFEWLFNTASHHRVHHGANEQYLDKNYGAILIIWDRLFGSFAEESEPVRFGLVHPVKSYNIAWLKIHVWYDLLRAFYRHPHAWRKIFLGRPTDLEALLPEAPPRIGDNQASPIYGTYYLAVQWALSAMLAGALFVPNAIRTQSHWLLLAGVIVASFSVLGILVSYPTRRASWENFRLLILTFTVGLCAGWQSPWFALAAAGLITSLMFHIRVRLGTVAVKRI